MSKRELLFAAFPILLLVLALPFRQRILAGFRRFLNEASHPIDLAFFRMAVFGVIFYQADPAHARFFGSLPDELYRLPVGFSVVQPILLGNPDLAYWLAVALQVAAALGFVGLFTRWAAWASALLATLVFGLAQCVGKVNHDTHHLVWFAVILALAPSGHALSVDRLLAAWREPKRWWKGVDEPSVAFGRPLRLAMLMIGLVYLYPGAAKLILGGPQWWSAENTIRIMQGDWLIGGFKPALLRLDHWPTLAMLGAVGTIVFELVYIGLLPSLRTRWMAAVGGLAFHNMTNLTMNIPFFSLQLMYGVFVPWARLFAWMGRKVRKEKLVVLFDGGCGICRRTAACLMSLDGFALLEFSDLHQIRSQGRDLPGLPTDEALLRDLHAYADGKWSLGVGAYARIVARLPLLWPIYPLLVIPGAKGIANRIYRKVADSRLCRIPLPGAAEDPVELVRPTLSRGPGIAAAVIAIAVTGFSSVRVLDAWPISGMPTYVWVANDTAPYLNFTFTRADGSTFTATPLKDETLRHHLYRNRRAGMHWWLMAHANTPEGQRRLRLFVDLWNRTSLHEDFVRVRVDRVTVPVNPALWDQPVKVEQVAAW